MADIKTTGPFLVVSIAALLTLAEYYFVGPQISDAARTLGSWVVIILAFSLIMATGRSFLYHMREVRRRAVGTWYYSLWFMILVVVLFSVGTYETPNGPNYVWWQTWIMGTTVGGIYVVVGMWMISAVFRTFRVRSLYTLGSVVALCLFVFGWILPIGESVAGLPPVASWLYDVVLTGSWRGVIMGAGIGIVYYGIRTILMRERRIFGA